MHHDIEQALPVVVPDLRHRHVAGVVRQVGDEDVDVIEAIRPRPESIAGGYRAFLADDLAPFGGEQGLDGGSHVIGSLGQ